METWHNGKGLDRVATCIRPDPDPYSCEDGGNSFGADQRRRNHWLIRSHQPVTERPCSIRSPLLAGC
jgi:hypothetical protein